MSSEMKREMNIRSNDTDREKVMPETHDRVREVLNALEPIEATDPWVTLDALRECLALQEDKIQAVVDKLIIQGAVVSTNCMHTGQDKYALADALEHPAYVADQEAYAALKAAVREAATAKGYDLRHVPGRGWLMLSGKTQVCEGSMRDLAGVLELPRELWDR